MRKLTLDLDALAVDSFVAGTERRADAGTVHAHNHTRGNHQTCGNQLTCGNTCNAGLTCNCPITFDDTCLEPCFTNICEDTVTCPVE
ncbi:MAG TPA: hypothetical protein VFX98_18910 [Longimicrobiaceae bacterium]|nr:hypothetical protein [Longimicrobiaceae bacterium]